MKTILSTRGYKISKRYITNGQIELIKKDLIIKPYTFMQFDFLICTFVNFYFRLLSMTLKLPLLLHH